LAGIMILQGMIFSDPGHPAGGRTAEAGAWLCASAAARRLAPLALLALRSMRGRACQGPACGRFSCPAA
jgi:hypothetical protein